MLNAFEYLLHGIFYGKHKARRKLLQIAPGVHERRGIGHECTARHEIIEYIRGRVHVGFAIELVRFSDVLRHAHKHIGRRLQGFAVIIFFEISFCEHVLRVR